MRNHCPLLAIQYAVMPGMVLYRTDCYIGEFTGMRLAYIHGFEHAPMSATTACCGLEMSERLLLPAIYLVCNTWRCLELWECLQLALKRSTAAVYCLLRTACHPAIYVYFQVYIYDIITGTTAVYLVHLFETSQGLQDIGDYY